MKVNTKRVADKKATQITIKNATGIAFCMNVTNTRATSSTVVACSLINVAKAGLQEPQFVPHFNVSPNAETDEHPSTIALLMVFSLTEKQLQTTGPFKNSSSTSQRKKLAT